MVYLLIYIYYSINLYTYQKSYNPFYIQTTTARVLASKYKKHLHFVSALIIILYLIKAMFKINVEN